MNQPTLESTQALRKSIDESVQHFADGLTTQEEFTNRILDAVELWAAPLLPVINPKEE